MDITSDYSVSSFLDDIETELKSGHFVAAFFMTLSVPDICCGENSKKGQYIQWFDKWIVNGDPKPVLRGEDCYNMRCSILHSGVVSKNFSLSIDSKNDIHIGHVISVITDNNTGEEDKDTRLNINDFVEMVLLGARAFIDKEGDELLFRLMDYGRIEY